MAELIWDGKHNEAEATRYFGEEGSVIGLGV